MSPTDKFLSLKRISPRFRAWHALERDAAFVSASEGYPGTESLYDTIRAILARRTAIMGIDRDPVPEKALGRQSLDAV